jgi:membrane associated rhomboid family serine protease
MGIYDRDYYRNTPRGGFGDFQTWSITTLLIAINVAVFIFDGLLARIAAGPEMPAGNGPLFLLGYFSIGSAIFHLQIWRFITYQFLHGGIQHLFFNMLALYFFGPIVEGQLGRGRYLAFYLSCGVAGALMYTILWTANVLVDGPLIGASASILGILAAGAVIAPGIRINLWFPPISVTLRTLAWFFVALAIYAVLISGENAGGEASHLGGAIWGYALIKNPQWLDIFGKQTFARATPRPRRKVAFRDWTRDMNH